MMPVFFVDAGDEQLIRSSATSRADELKIFLLFLQFFQKIIKFFKYFLQKIHK